MSDVCRRPISGLFPGTTSGSISPINTGARVRSDQELPSVEKAGLHANLQLGPEGQMLLVLRSDYRRLGQSISISVAQDYTPVRRSFQLMQRIGLGIGLTALIAILLLQRVTVRRALRPLENARKQIAQ